MDEFEYDIGGKKYTQRPLVLGQVSQLIKCLPSITFPKDGGAFGLVAALGDKLPGAIAIVLIPDGVALKDKDLDALAAELEFGLELETAAKVIEDFFACNPLSSLSERVEAMTRGFAAVKKGGTRLPGSSGSSSSSPEEISPGETPSSGDTPPQSAGSGPGTGEERSSTGKPSSDSSE